MNELIKITQTKEGQLVVTSRQVAESFGKRHDHVIAAIESIKTENSGVTSMFFETSYQAGTGKNYKQYLMNRDGFSLLVMGFTGKEALSWKLKYIQAFNEMEAAITKKHFDELKERRVAVMQQNAKSREAALWLKIGENVPIPEYKQICASYASKTLAGLAVLPLPVMEQQYYTAQEVGTRIGITGNMVGRIANAHGLKAPQGQANKYGRWFWDKAKHCSKEVPAWKYTDDGANAIEKFFREEKSCFM